MKRKKKRLSFSASRRFIAIMLAFAMCLTLSGFWTLAVYGGNDSDTEAVNTSTDVTDADETDADGNDEEDVDADDDDDADAAGQNETDADGDNDADVDDADSADTDKGEEDSLISPQSVDDEEEDGDDPDGEGDDEEEDFEPSFWLEYEMTDKNSNHVLVDETRTISFTLCHNGLDDNGDYYEEEYAEEFKLTASAYDESSVDVNIDGTKMTVTGREENENAIVHVTAFIDDEEVASEEIWFSVTGSYYVLSYHDEIPNVDLGDTIDLSSIEWYLTRYYTEDGNTSEVIEVAEEDSIEVYCADDYDWLAWNPVEEDESGPQVMQRTHIYRTGLDFVAKNTDENNVLAMTSVSFEELNYWNHLEYDQDCLFSGESMDIRTECEEGDFPDCIDIKWEVEAESTDAAALEEHEDDKTLATLTAGKVDGDTWVTVRASLYYGNIMLDWAEAEVQIRDSYEEYSMPETDTMLWTDWWWIDKNSVTYFVQNAEYPEGYEESRPITNIAIDKQFIQDEDGVLVDAEDTVARLEEEEDGWNLIPETCGYVKLAITYETVDGEEATGYTEVAIAGDRYFIDWEYPDGTDGLLPGTTMTIPLGMHHDGVTEDGEYFWEEIEDFTVEAIWDGDNAAMEVTEDRELVFTGVSEGYVSFCVICRTDDGVECMTWIGIDVTSYFCNLVPVSLENVEQGGTLDLGSIDWQLWIYDAENEEPVIYTAEDYPEEHPVRFRLVDYGGWSADDEEAELPVLTRTSADGAWITVIAEMEGDEADEDGNRWTEMISREYGFDGLDYSVWFETDVNRVYSDGSLTLPLNTENLEDKENAEIKWTVGLWNEETEEFDEVLDNSFYTESDSSITLNGEALSAAGIERVRVRASVMAVGEEVYAEDIEVEVEDPELSWEDEEHVQVLPGWTYYYTDKQATVSIRNTDYPEGEDVTLKITDVTADKENVVEIRDDGSFCITALPEGIGNSAEVTFTLWDEDKGHEYKFTMTFDVVEERLTHVTYMERENGSLEMFNEYLLPEESLQLDTTFYLHTYDAVTKESNVAVLEDAVITYSYDNEEYPGLLTVTPDGRVTVNRPEDMEDEIWTYVTVTVSYVGEDGSEKEESEEIWLCVTAEYETWETRTLYLEPGDTTSIGDGLVVDIKRYTQENPNGVVVSTVPVKLLGAYSDYDELTIGEDGTTLTVSKDIVITDEIYKISVQVENEDGEIRDIFLPVQVDDHEHIWDEGKVTKEPTCTEDGERTYTCTKCGETKTEPIPGGHILDHYGRVEPTTTANGNIEYWYCEVCGKYFSDAEAKNEISASAIILPATKNTTGGQITETGSTNGTGSTAETGSTNGTSGTGDAANTNSTGSTSSTSTGDRTMIFLWFAIMAGAFGVLFTVGTKRRRSR